MEEHLEILSLLKAIDIKTTSTSLLVELVLELERMSLWLCSEEHERDKIMFYGHYYNAKSRFKNEIDRRVTSLL